MGNKHQAAPVEKGPGRLSLTARWLSQTSVGITVLSLLLSLLVLILLVAAFGSDPGQVLKALIKGSFRGSASLISMLEEMAVLMICGLAILIPIKGGYFNIAIQGQLEIGAFCGCLVAIYCPGPAFLVIPLALIAGALSGMAVGLIPLTLRVKRGASEVTTGLMLNFVCTYFVYAMIYGPFLKEGAFFATTESIPKANLLPDLFGPHIGFYLALILCLLAHVLTTKTTYGSRLFATGYNRRAAQAAGINVKTIMNSGVMLGAGLAGLAGIIEIMGVLGAVSYGWMSNWGFTGVCIAFLGGNALGVIPISFLLAIIGTGGRYMQSMTGVPVSLVGILTGMPVVIFLIFTAIKLTATSVDIRQVWKKGSGEKPGGAAALAMEEEVDAQ